MKWTKIKDELPPSHSLVWCKRNNGAVYLAMRSDRPIAETKDPSRDCFWFGEVYMSGQSDSIIQYDLTRNFSDITVDSWGYLVVPK